VEAVLEEMERDEEEYRDRDRDTLATISEEEDSERGTSSTSLSTKQLKVSTEYRPGIFNFTQSKLLTMLVSK
jgi:hypothetical protein